MIGRMEKTIESMVEYYDELDGYHEGFFLNKHSSSNDWLKEFVGKKVRIRIELIEK